MIRKVCVVVNSRANYGRIRPFLRAATVHPGLKLQLIVGASALLFRYGNVLEEIQRDGFTPDATVHSIVDGGTPSTMAKSTGLATMELATHFSILQPDIVLTVADRFETMATAIAASYMNIPLAHTQGGEVSGSIDESVRHAVTKLAHIHFPATSRAREFLIKMGENPETVFLTGCPSIDVAANVTGSADIDLFQRYGGVGPAISPEKPYVVVLQHPVTTEYESAGEQIDQTISAIRDVINDGLQAIWLWPNVDAGSDEISKKLREFRETPSGSQVQFFRNFSPEDYLRVLLDSACLIGNSSSGIREGSFLGIPTVNIGSRQADRERGRNVIDVGYDSEAIGGAIRSQIAHGHYEREIIFGDGAAGQKIAEILSEVPLTIAKRLNYLEYPHPNSGAFGA